jgi:hypothetical protein
MALFWHFLKSGSRYSLARACARATRARHIIIRVRTRAREGAIFQLFFEILKNRQKSSIFDFFKKVHIFRCPEPGMP